MVGGDIGHHRHFGAFAHADELEAGQLDHRHILRGHLAQNGQQGPPDVAAEVHPAPGLLQHGRDQAGGGGLAVRAGHRDDLAGAVLEKQLHLAGDAGPGRLGRLQRRGVILKAGGAQDEVLPGKAVHVALAQAQRDPLFGQHAAGLAKIGEARLAVTQGYPGPHFDELRDQLPMADPRPDKGHLFAPDPGGEGVPFTLHANHSFSSQGRAALRRRACNASFLL